MHRRVLLRNGRLLNALFHSLHFYSVLRPGLFPRPRTPTSRICCSFCTAFQSVDGWSAFTRLLTGGYLFTFFLLKTFFNVYF